MRRCDRLRQVNFGFFYCRMLHRRNVPALRTIASLNQALEPAPETSKTTACWKGVLEKACALDSTTDLDALNAHVAECYGLLASHPQLSLQDQRSVQRNTLQLMDFIALLKEAKALACPVVQPATA